jgi:hypothetical protein
MWYIKLCINQLQFGSASTQLLFFHYLGRPFYDSSIVSHWIGALGIRGKSEISKCCKANVYLPHTGNLLEVIDCFCEILQILQGRKSVEGSESYWPSHSETSFAIDPAVPTASPYPVVNLPPTEMYIAAAAAAMIIAVAIIGALILISLRKRPLKS